MRQQLKWEDSEDYDNQIDIEIRLKSAMSKEDYKTILDAANTIMETASPYIVRPEVKLRAVKK